MRVGEKSEDVKLELVGDGKILSTVWEFRCMVLTQIGQAGFYSDFGGVGAGGYSEVAWIFIGRTDAEAEATTL